MPMTLSWIIFTCIFGGVISFIFALLFLKYANSNLLNHMVSLAVGTLLGAAFLEIIPHAFELSNDVHQVTFVVLIGILILFILEKLLIWRHCHGIHCEAHSAESHFEMNNKGSFVLIGDLFHNFVDGVLIASAFLVNINLGLVTALAIIAHEIPQEVSNISILVNSGFSKVKALSFNVIASITTVIGGVLAFFVLDTLRSLIPIILAFAASTMLYVAVSDLIPDLHKKTAIRDSLMQVLLISSGVIIIYIIHSFLN